MTLKNKKKNASNLPSNQTSVSRTMYWIFILLTVHLHGWLGGCSGGVGWGWVPTYCHRPESQKISYYILREKKNQNSKHEMSPLDTCHSGKLKNLNRVIVGQGRLIYYLAWLWALRKLNYMQTSWHIAPFMGHIHSYRVMYRSLSLFSHSCTPFYGDTTVHINF